MLHLDFLRIVAALGIVALHWRGSLALPDGPSALLEHRMDGLNQAVDLFFVISGAVIHHVYRGQMSTGRQVVTFLRKRLARLAPLHWATLLLYVVLGFVALKAGASPKSAARYDPSCILPNILFLQATGMCRSATYNFASWSISAELVVYMLAPLFLFLRSRAFWLPALLAGVCLVILCAIGPAGQNHTEWYRWTYDQGFWRAIPAFALGVSLDAARPLLRRLPHAATATFLAMGALVILSLMDEWRGAVVIMTYVVVALAIAADARGQAHRLVRTFAPMGQLTYSVYMLHLPMQTVLLSMIGERVLHLPPAAQNGLVLLAVPLLLACSYLSLFFFEQPLRRLMSGQRRSAPKAEPLLSVAP